MGFPGDFVWGTAMSAYQIEGAHQEDGKGLNVWDAFCRRPGKVFGGHTGDVACDHYHRFGDDLKLMAALGIRNYRFSVNWSRVLPDGTGQPNEKGLSFYDRLLDSMLENGIKPWLTRPGTRRGKDQLPAPLPAGVQACGGGGRACDGVLPLELSGQFRVGERLQRPLRPGLRGLRDPGAAAQGLRRVV